MEERVVDGGKGVRSGLANSSTWASALGLGAFSESRARKTNDANPKGDWGGKRNLKLGRDQEWARERVETEKAPPSPTDLLRTCRDGRYVSDVRSLHYAT